LSSFSETFRIPMEEGWQAKHNMGPKVFRWSSLVACLLIAAGILDLLWKN